MNSIVLPKAVVVLAGARDRYQLPLALNEAGILHKMVTDMYWPADRKWFSASLGSFISEASIYARFCTGIKSTEVSVSKKALIGFFIAKSTKNRNIQTYQEMVLGVKARNIATKNQTALFSYSYYAYEAFNRQRESVKYRFIFQLHPHPRAVRNILIEELDRTPKASSSLMMENELRLSKESFEKLAIEPHMANGWVVASSYTAKSLSEYGIPYENIRIVPYGVDANKFPRRVRSSIKKPFTVVFVGSMVQRKGLSYLLEAIRILNTKNIRTVLCGRGFVDNKLINTYRSNDVEIKVGLSHEQLVQQLHESDVFVLPSLAEGFAHVILEAMSCGLPIIATSHTCAPDVIKNGSHGFIVPIRNAESIAEKLAWGIDHRDELSEMGEAAADQARLFTWHRFRSGIRSAYANMIESVQ